MMIMTMIMGMTTGTTTTMIDATAAEAAEAEPVGARALYRLMAWLSPAYPVGAFTYSHGLENAVDTGRVTNPDSTAGFITTVLRRGGGWTDAVLFVGCYRAAQAGDDANLHQLADLAAAFRGSEEMALESTQQGGSFMRTTRMAWPDSRPDSRLEAFAKARTGRITVYPVAVAVACAGIIPLQAALPAYLHAFVANLVSAAVRLIPLGQTDGQLVLARLEALVGEMAEKALRADVAMLGSAAPMIDLHSIHHETQYTRLFRS